MFESIQSVWLKLRTRPMTDSLTVVMPHYGDNKGESPWFLRKISLKIACKLAIKIETVSCPCNTCFWYALALALKNTSLGCAAPRDVFLTIDNRINNFVSYSQRSSVSKTRIAWRDRFYICIVILDFSNSNSPNWPVDSSHSVNNELVKRLPIGGRLLPAFYIGPHAGWNYGIVTPFL